MIELKNPPTTAIAPEDLPPLIQSVIIQTQPIAGELAVKKRHESFVALKEELELALARTRICAQTATLSKLEESRDDYVDLLDSHLETAIKGVLLDKTKADQAKVVKAIRDQFGNDLTEHANLTESGEISAMITSFETIEGAVLESGAAPIISALDSVNKQYITVFNQKVDTLEHSIPTRRLAAIRGDIAREIRFLIGFINNAASLNPVQYEKIVIDLDSLFAVFKAKAEAAKTRRETEQEKTAAAN